MWPTEKFGGGGLAAKKKEKACPDTPKHKNIPAHVRIYYSGAVSGFGFGLGSVYFWVGSGLGSGGVKVGFGLGSV